MTPEQEPIWVSLGWTDFKGPCELCGTDHGGFHRDFPYGHLRCLHERAATSGDPRLVESQETLEQSFRETWDEGMRARDVNVSLLRAAGMLPPLL